MTRYQSDIELDEIEFDQSKLRSLRVEIHAMQARAKKLEDSINARLILRDQRMRNQRELAEAAQ